MNSAHSFTEGATVNMEEYSRLEKEYGNVASGVDKQEQTPSKESSMTNDRNKIEELFLKKNIHSVYTHCNKCGLFGINKPWNHICGNCCSEDTILYYDIDTISNQLNSFQAENERLKEEVKEKTSLAMDYRNQIQALQSKLDMVKEYCEVWVDFESRRQILNLLK